MHLLIVFVPRRHQFVTSFFFLQYPVSFGLNLAIPADKVLETKQLVNVIPETEVLKNTGGQGDEADSGRTKVSPGQQQHNNYD